MNNIRRELLGNTPDCELPAFLLFINLEHLEGRACIEGFIATPVRYHANLIAVLGGKTWEENIGRGAHPSVRPSNDEKNTHVLMIPKV